LNLNIVLADPVASKHLYICGPTGFMNWVIDTARQKGWSEETIHREYFAAEAIDTSNDESFTIKIASTGQEIVVEKDQCATDVLAAAGFPIDITCSEGICGTCLSRVLAGEIEHRDMFLMD